MDSLDHTNSFFRKAYTHGYEYMVGELPKLWAVFFDLADREWAQPLFQGARRVYNGLNTAPLVKFIKENNFDVIMTAHFLSTEVVGYLRRTGQFKGKLVTVVTDYDVHKIWLTRGVDEYCVATEFTKARLVAMGVAPSNVFVTGIPVDEKFCQARDKAELRRKLGADPSAFTVLLSTSSFGFGPIEALAEKLKDVQLFIISGNNKQLKERLTAKNNPKHKVMGFVDNMDELMAAADVMLTKPGGLSISEALVNGLPLVFFSPIPGQEAGNVRVLAANGVGDSDKTIDEMAAILKEYAASSKKLAEARAASLKLAKPNAVSDIIARFV